MRSGNRREGVEVQLAGLSVIAAESASDLSSSRYWLTLAGIVLVGLALLLIYRSWRRALVPLVPTVLATGWASLLLWVTGIPLNPMSAALGALTIAIATEFGVLLSGRFHEERQGGLEVEEALQRAYSRTGAAVIASGATAIAGFAVLIASDVQMLRDFGLRYRRRPRRRPGRRAAGPAGDVAACWSGDEGPLLDHRRADLPRDHRRRHRQHAPGWRGRGDARPRPAARRAGRCRSSRFPKGRGSLKATPTSPRTTAKPRRSPARRTRSGRRPAASSCRNRSGSATSSTGRW